MLTEILAEEEKTVSDKAPLAVPEDYDESLLS